MNLKNLPFFYVKKFLRLKYLVHFGSSFQKAPFFIENDGWIKINLFIHKNVLLLKTIFKQMVLKLLSPLKRLFSQLILNGRQ